MQLVTWLNVDVDPSAITDDKRSNKNEGYFIVIKGVFLFLNIFNGLNTLIYIINSLFVIMAPQRKKPFSAKAKKEQLKSKKQFKQEGTSGRRMPNLLLSRSSDDEDDADVQKINKQPVKGKNVNRYNLQFRKDTDAEVRLGKEEAQKSLCPVEPEGLEVNVDEFFPPDLRFPTRPTWDFSMSKEELIAIENRHFSECLKQMDEKFNFKSLSYFELNLETWRQLWRVLEMSDVLLIIVDIRFSALMFPPFLYHYVTQELKKSMILVLNKIDLVPPSVTVAWKDYFKTKYPELEIITFTSFPSYNLRCAGVKSSGLQVRKRKGRMRMAAEGAQNLYDACKKIVNDEVDISSWDKKIKEEMNVEYEDEDVEIGETINLKAQDTTYYEFKRFDGGVLTIGCLGQPNVGKSSLMNALMGKKVVSVSKTPGHTKHFQTIFLTSNVRLCDCPGLVFPSKVPKVIQILMGSYPIAQLREPYSAVKFIAERVDLVKLLRLQHPNNDDEWSAMDVCDGWSLKRKFYTAKTARLDTYRGANNLLRLALDGRIVLNLLPPGFVKNKEKWENHSEVETIEWILAKRQEEKISDLSSYDESEEEYERKLNKKGSSKRDQEEDKDEDGDDEEDDESDEIPTGNKFAALKNI